MHEFLFTNELDVPVKIVSVKASCGCTTPGWSKDEILPGESGFVQAQYNPRNRPGKFRKSLKVTTSAPEDNVTAFFITGTVIGRPRTPADDFPVLLGSIRFKSRTLSLGRVTTQGPVTRDFEIYNDGSKPVTFLPDQTQAPAHVQLQFPSPTINPKERGRISITYDPVKKDDLGYVNDRLVLKTDEDSAAAKQLHLVANIYESFARLTAEQLSLAPRLTLDETSYDFGRIEVGASLITEFEISNQGASNLNIRKAKSNCSCISFTLGKYDLQPDESTTLKITFDTTGRKGNMQKVLTIFSNDPRGSAQMVTLTAFVRMSTNP